MSLSNAELRATVLKQIFTQGNVGGDDLNTVNELFPGLIVNPADLRKEVFESGKLSLERFVECWCFQ